MEFRGLSSRLSRFFPLLRREIILKLESLCQNHQPIQVPKHKPTEIDFVLLARVERQEDKTVFVYPRLR